MTELVLLPEVTQQIKQLKSYMGTRSRMTSYSITRTRERFVITKKGILILFPQIEDLKT